MSTPVPFGARREASGPAGARKTARGCCDLASEHCARNSRQGSVTTHDKTSVRRRAFVPKKARPQGGRAVTPGFVTCTLTLHLVVIRWHVRLDVSLCARSITPYGLVRILHLLRRTGQPSVRSALHAPNREQNEPSRLVFEHRQAKGRVHLRRTIIVSLHCDLI